MTWFHTTTPNNVEKILAEGMKTGSAPTYSMGSLDYMNNVYGMIPIFLSKRNIHYDGDTSSVILEVNIDGLEDKLAADVPTLAASFEAMIDEKGIWFEDDWFSDAAEKVHEAFGEDEYEISYQDLLYGWAKEPAIELTQTAAFLGNIPANRIRFATEQTNLENQSTILSSYSNSGLLLEKEMLKDLVKVANKLDSIGLTKEADFIDMQILALASELEEEIIPDDLSDEDLIESTEPMYNNPGRTSPEERLLTMLFANETVTDMFPGQSPEEIGTALGISDDSEVMNVLRNLVDKDGLYSGMNRFPASRHGEYEYGKRYGDIPDND